MVNTFLILLSYCVDLGTFVLLCQAPEIASHGTAEQCCCTEMQGTMLAGEQGGFIVRWSGFAPSLRLLRVASAVTLGAEKFSEMSDLTVGVLKYTISNCLPSSGYKD